jgi:hypothetical protein
MMWSRILIVPLVLVMLAPVSPAGIFSRKTKPNPAERVPELLLQLRTSSDEAQRAAAAEELRQYDPKSFSDVIPALIDSLTRDTSPAVRSEAASSLGRMRPISQQAGYALEQAQNNDAAVRVRLAARQSLLQYHIVGYRGGKPAEGTASATTPSGTTPAPAGTTMPANSRPIIQPTSRSGAVTPPATGRESAEPPLAMPAARSPSQYNARPPAKAGPVNPGLQPAPTVPAPTRPLPSSPLDGPALPPPG